MAKVVFISGAMKGYDNFNRDAFNRAEESLKSQGYVVLNPAWLPDGMTDAQYIAIDTTMLMQADMVYMLKGWETSSGATAEHLFAQRMGLPVMVQSPPSPDTDTVSDSAEFDFTIKSVAHDEPSCDTDGLSWETIREYIDFADEHFADQEGADRFISNMIRFENWRNCDYDASFWGIDGEDE